MLQDRTWLLIGRKMAEEASPQELKELEDILRHNPELHFSLQTINNIWQHSPTENEQQLEEAYRLHLERMKLHSRDVPGAIEEDFNHHPGTSLKTSKGFINRHKLAICAGIGAVFLISAALFFYPGNKTESKADSSTKPILSEVSTRYGSKTNIVLPDGTKVWLNAGSKLTYDKSFGEAIRRVTLSGEAYFDVTHNDAKPFVIHTTAMDIKVLGTEFNVKSYPDEVTTEASLIRGKIEVTLKDKRAEKIIMQPNEKLVVSNETAEEPAEATIQNKKVLKHSAPIINLGHLNYFSRDSSIMETSWVNNRLIFEDESFAEVATKMSRWYGVDFNFKGKEIQKVRFTGNLKDETVEEALKAMQITADFHFKITDKHITITQDQSKY